DDNIVQPALARLEAAIGAASGPPAGPTLADLSCTTGQIAARLSSGWTCLTPRPARVAVTEDVHLLDDGGDGPGGFRAGGNAALAIARDGRPVVVHQIADPLHGGADLATWLCDDVHCTSGSARVLELGAGAVLGDHASIALGASGNPVIAHADASNGFLLAFVCSDATCGGGGATRILDRGDGDRVGSYASIAVGADGVPVIAHQNATLGTLEVFVCADVGCTGGTGRTLDDGKGDRVGAFASIAVGADGNPVIAYGDSTLGALKLFVCGDAHCTRGTARILEVGSGERVGLEASLAIGADGNPVIAHRGSSGVLRLHACGDPSCGTGSSHIVDPDAGSVGRVSVTIDASGTPLVAYRDESRGVVKLATCVDAVCTSARPRVLAVSGSSRIGGASAVAGAADGAVLVVYEDTVNASLMMARAVVVAEDTSLSPPATN
ncbi:MAG: hypothetical protein D6683_06950, partial [Actinomyces sp.]